MPGPASSEAKPAAAKSAAAFNIVFNVSKREVNHPTNGFKKLHRKLKGQAKVSVNKEELAYQNIADAHILVFGGPKDKFKEAEFQALKQYVEKGGSVLFLSGEGGDSKTGTNFNYFLEEYGIEVNNDSVIRTTYFKYLHPKEVLISDGVVNKELNRVAGKKPGAAIIYDNNSKTTIRNPLSQNQINFVYPYGSSLNVVKPAVPILSSGFIAYPLNRPLAACYTKKGAGRILVFGTCSIFDDKWLEEEENNKLQEILFKWLLGEWNLDQIDAESWDLSDYHYLPNTEQLAERLRCCLQETEEIPKDHTQMYDDTLFKFDTDIIPEINQLYEELGVKHDPLTLIPPQFEVPLPPLKPAAFPPILNEPPAPLLDLYDLDEQFASERVRLAFATNLCTENDLEYYVKEAGEVLGVTAHLKPENRTGKHILEYIMKQVANWKKLNQELPMDVM